MYIWITYVCIFYQLSFRGHQICLDFLVTVFTYTHTYTHTFKHIDIKMKAHTARYKREREWEKHNKNAEMNIENWALSRTSEVHNTFHLDLQVQLFVVACLCVRMCARNQSEQKRKKNSVSMSQYTHKSYPWQMETCVCVCVFTHIFRNEYMMTMTSEIQSQLS